MNRQTKLEYLKKRYEAVGLDSVEFLRGLPDLKVVPEMGVYPKITYEGTTFDVTGIYQPKGSEFTYLRVIAEGGDLLNETTITTGLFNHAQMVTLLYILSNTEDYNFIEIDSDE